MLVHSQSTWHIIFHFQRLQSYHQQSMQQSYFRYQRLRLSSSRDLYTDHYCRSNRNTGGGLCDNHNHATVTYSLWNDCQMWKILPSSEWRLLSADFTQQQHQRSAFREDQPVDQRKLYESESRLFLLCFSHPGLERDLECDLLGHSQCSCTHTKWDY